MSDYFHGWAKVDLLNEGEENQMYTVWDTICDKGLGVCATVEEVWKTVCQHEDEQLTMEREKFPNAPPA